ncbi:M23 family metallopeptidase [Neobacillus sp. CF12]|uniref:M23 family metallopeptidase n=1 Tax=Neobacillus sp. CF12 TaxID=3055864 RepID=UPI0025A037B2|nr:M23 family metallopeptidase [Neobacillus sp. CF12]MDM5330344.1 M23 family metallopeptidase [Neobacillus sp. CF12]
MILRITSKFGSVDAVHKTPHTGIDLAMPEGTTLRALGEGVVDRIYDGTTNFGKGLSIKFDDGTRVIYGHMNEVKARIGEHVHACEIIGLSGNTGNSTGPHLHLGMRAPDGDWLDPTPLADNVVNHVGQINWWDGPITQIKGWLGEKFTEITVDGFVDFIADIALALPFLAVVGGSVYALINIFSKGAAKWSAIATVIYGLFIIRHC